MDLNLGALKVYIRLPYRSLWMLAALITFTILAYFLMVRLRKRRVTKFANFSTLRRIHGYRVWIPHPGILFLKIVVVTLLFLVATQSIELNLVKPVANTDFVLAIDSSQSMLIPDYEPNRLEIAKSVALKWLSKLPAATSIGVIEFSEKARPLVSLTTNPSEVESAINSIKVSLNSSGTAIGDALELSISMLSTSNKQRFVILITDGKSNTGINVSRAIEDCRKNRVVVYTIGIGETNQTKTLFSRLRETAKRMGISGEFNFPRLDEEELKKIASETGGKFFLVTNQKMFEEAFKHIIIKNERIPLNSDYYILLFITILLIIELVAYAKLGAL